MLEELARDYTEYSDKVRITQEFGNRCEDVTPKGQKGMTTRKYNKFADACEAAGLTLKEQTAILRKAINA